jgi:hypothetical protein
VYDQATARWISKDPIGFAGGTNLYEYVNGRPTIAVDPGGDQIEWWGGIPPYEESPRTVINCHPCVNWMAKERQSDKSWLDELPDCPCTLPTTNGNPANPDPKKWFDPGDAPPTHHEAKWCIRSKPVKKNGPGQQCCYDNLGKLLTHGGGAGTPDKIAPVDIDSIVGHYGQDVQSYRICPLSSYLIYRPPNNGNNCPTNP